MISGNSHKKHVINVYHIDWNTDSVMPNKIFKNLKAAEFGGQTVIR